MPERIAGLAGANYDSPSEGLHRVKFNDNVLAQGVPSSLNFFMHLIVFLLFERASTRDTWKKHLKVNQSCVALFPAANIFD